MTTKGGQLTFGLIGAALLCIGALAMHLVLDEYIDKLGIERSNMDEGTLLVAEKFVSLVAAGRSLPHTMRTWHAGKVSQGQVGEFKSTLGDSKLVLDQPGDAEAAIQVLATLVGAQNLRRLKDIPLMIGSLVHQKLTKPCSLYIDHLGPALFGSTKFEEYINMQGFLEQELNTICRALALKDRSKLEENIEHGLKRFLREHPELPEQQPNNSELAELLSASETV